MAVVTVAIAMLAIIQETIEQRELSNSFSIGDLGNVANNTANIAMFANIPELGSVDCVLWGADSDL